MNSNFSLSIVLPAHNEEENIKNTLDKCLSYVEQNIRDYEIIVVNDGSVDRTREIAEKLSAENSGIKLVNHKVNQGYGSALRSGFDAATKDYVFLMDSDGQFDISDLNALIPHVGENQAVIGYRRNRADSLIRSLNAWLYGLYIYVCFGLRVKDMDCAFKIFPIAAYRSVQPIKSDGALFSAELLIKFQKQGYTLKEIPVRHFPREYGVQSGANLQVILKMFKESWKLRNELRDN